MFREPAVDASPSKRPSLRSAIAQWLWSEPENSALPVADADETADQVDAALGQRVEIERRTLGRADELRRRYAARTDDVVDCRRNARRAGRATSSQRWMSRPRYVRGIRMCSPTAERHVAAAASDLVRELQTRSPTRRRRARRAHRAASGRDTASPSASARCRGRPLAQAGHVGYAVRAAREHERRDSATCRDPSRRDSRRRSPRPT